MFDNVTSLPMSSIRAACTSAMVMPPPPPVGEEDPGLIFLLAQVRCRPIPFKHTCMHLPLPLSRRPHLLAMLIATWVPVCNPFRPLATCLPC